MAEARTERGSQGGAGGLGGAGPSRIRKGFSDTDLRVSREPLCGVGTQAMQSGRASKSSYQPRLVVGGGVPSAGPSQKATLAVQSGAGGGQGQRGRLMFGRRNCKEDSGFWLSN